MSLPAVEDLISHETTSCQFFMSSWVGKTVFLWFKEILLLDKRAGIFHFETESLLELPTSNAEVWKLLTAPEQLPTNWPEKGLESVFLTVQFVSRLRTLNTASPRAHDSYQTFLEYLPREHKPTSAAELAGYRKREMSKAVDFV